MKLFSRSIVLLLGATAAVLPVTATEIYKIDTAHSTIAFKVRQFINTTNGRFKQFSGTIELDRDHPEKSSVVAKIEARSIDTNIRKRDDHLRSAEFFNVAKYPEITFKSRSVKRTGAQSGDIQGDLIMHGVTRPITLHVKLVTPLKSDDAATARSHWEVTADPLKRREFNLLFSRATEAISGISQEVTVKIDIDAIRAP